MDFWPDNDFDFDRVFRTTVNPKGVDPEVAKLRQELNEFKTELKPWLQEVGDSRKTKLELLKTFIQTYIVSDPSGKLSVKEFNPMFVKYVHTKSGLIVEPTSIKGYMESLFNKPKDDPKFWYKGHRECFYSGLRWKTPEDSSQITSADASKRN
jgi:hypothetical protein